MDENEGPGAVPRHQLTDDLRRLLTCIGRLEPDRQRMLLLAYYETFSREELSIKLDVPVNLEGVAPPQSERDRAVSRVMNGISDPGPLAAEYVLGTLDSSQRAEARDLLSTSEAFVAKVKLWERRLGELRLMVEPGRAGRQDTGSASRPESTGPARSAGRPSRAGGREALPVVTREPELPSPAIVPATSSEAVAADAIPNPPTPDVVAEPAMPNP